MSAIRYKCPRCEQDTLKRNGHYPDQRQRWTCRGQSSKGKHCYSTHDPKAPERRQDGSVVKKQSVQKVQLRGERFVITWAQNGTPVHKEFLACLRTYCRVEGAQLLVIPGRYKNPTSTWSASQANADTWDTELLPYLVSGRRRLNGNLTLLADLKIQPTAVTPLTGFESLTGPESGIVGHPKLQLKTVATPANRMAKILTTTGAVTVKNYTDTRAGKGGEFHHVFGAALVEIVDNKRFHLRQLMYSEKDHGFIDKNKAYFADSTGPAGAYKAAICGDAHARFADPVVVEGTFGKGGLIELLDPEVVVFHDLLDSYAVNPHHFGDPFKAIAKQRFGYDNIRDEVAQALDYLLKWTNGRKAVLVPSNHDDMLRRWIIRADWKEDPVNAEFYLETALHMARSTRMTASGAHTHDPFQYHVQQRADLAHVFCIPHASSYLIAGIELGQHGDAGPNGARGTVKNLSRIGVRSMTGHGHSPAIEEGHWRVGTMTPLKLEYTGSIGSWLNTHGSINAFGKRCLHTSIDGRFWL